MTGTPKWWMAQTWYKFISHSQKVQNDVLDWQVVLPQAVIEGPKFLLSCAAVIFNTCLPRSSYLSASSCRRGKSMENRQGKFLRARSGSDTHHFHSLTIQATWLCINNYQGGWKVVPKKAWVGDQWLGQWAQIKMTVLLPRKKRGWTLGGR